MDSYIDMKMMLIGRFFIFAIVVVLVFILIGCGRKNENVKVGDLAYSNNSDQYCVYINEGGKYVPFFVLTDKYTGGNALLLRKEVLEEKQRVNEYSSFYEDSEVDVFLNSEYYSRLEDIQSLIQDTEVTITEDNSIGKSGLEVKNINRSIFLLSCEELGFDSSVNAGLEGKALNYFSNPDNRIAYSGSNAKGWILRTPNTYFLSTVYGVGTSGVLDIVNAFDESGIRPALCVKSSELVSEKEGVIDGTKVYVLE
jgi:hypothetical protein